jgi:hypothetical protein
VTGRTPAAGETPSDAKDTDPPGVQIQAIRIQGDQLPEASGIPVRLVRGDASADELSALIAVFAVLSNAGSDEGEGDRSDEGQTDRPSSGNRTYPRSRWSSPARMVRTTHPHGPGGWRASAFPRYRSNRPSGPLHTSG